MANRPSLRSLLSWRKLRWRLANRDVPEFDPSAVPGEFASQYGQDAFVVDLFGGKRDGVFVDIGANDGVSLSNSYVLERQYGWSGLLVEPHASTFEKLVGSRSSRAVQACAAPDDGVVRFSQIEGGANMLSGVSSLYSRRHRRRVARALRKQGGHLSEVEVPAVRIDRLVEEMGFARVDYLSVDTEGGERAIVDAIDLDRFEVGCISMENNSQDTSVREYMAGRGYRLATILGCDELYVREGLDRPARRLAA